MNYSLPKPSRAEIESLLAIEGVLVPEPPEFRSRVVERARAALPTNLRISLSNHSPRSRRLLLGRLAAAAVVLSTLCALAYYAGYQAKNRSSQPTVGTVDREPSAVASTDSSRSLAPRPPTSDEPAAAESPPVETKPVRPAKSIAEGEAYAMELRVLQPAQQAVARRDFASALTAIGEHQHRFPFGRLTEEREALRVKALLGLGRRAEAQRAGAAFRNRFPRSAVLARIDAILGSQK